MGIMRLDRFLSQSGIGTRNEVKSKIKSGCVMVDNEKAASPNLKIDTEINVVVVDGKEINYNKFVYIMLNKPAGVVSAVKDKEFKTVIDILKKEDYKKGMFPMGRLDRDTVGLLILTNNGKLSHNTLSPKKHVMKKYFAEVLGKLSENDIEEFKNGIVIGNVKLKSAKLEIVEAGDRSKAFVEISEGKFHQIKKMFHKIGKEVVYLKRVAFGGILLDDNLKEGEYRYLNDIEIEILSEYMKESEEI